MSSARPCYPAAPAEKARGSCTVASWTIAAVSESYAQFAEDRLLEGIFAHREHGFCVEVGAYDGRTGSASLLFERRGWDCLLVEPIPELAEEIKRHRRARLASCAASSERGEATFFVAEKVEQMSTLQLTREHQRWIGEVGGTVREIKVATRTLDDILADAAFPRIDFITIDVEGHELEVLRGLSLERHRPRVVIVEQNSNRPQSPVARHMAASGYVGFRQTGVNEWFAHGADSELIQPDEIRRFRKQQRRRRLKNRIANRVEAWIAAPLARVLPEPVKRPLRGLLRFAFIGSEPRPRD